MTTAIGPGCRFEPYMSPEYAMTRRAARKSRRQLLSATGLQCSRRARSTRCEYTVKEVLC
jgi:hypothetical protein